MDTLGSSSIYFCSMGISVLRPAFTWKMEGAKPKIVSGTVPNQKKDKNSIKLLNNHMQGVLKASANTSEATDIIGSYKMAAVGRTQRWRTKAVERESSIIKA